MLHFLENVQIPTPNSIWIGAFSDANWEHLSPSSSAPPVHKSLDLKLGFIWWFGNFYIVCNTPLTCFSFFCDQTVLTFWFSLMQMSFMLSGLKTQHDVTGFAHAWEVLEYEGPLTEIYGLWLIPAALELQYCRSRAATTCGSRAALKYFVCKLVFRL